MKALRFAFEAAVFRALLALARWTPRRALLALGGGLGRAAYVLDRRHRRVSLDNLRLAYPDETAAGIRRLARSSWRQIGRNVLDALNFPSFGAHSAGIDVHYEGLEYIREAYRQGRGVLLFSGHFGQWELTALLQGYLGLPLILITRPLDNPALERLLGGLRRRSGNRVVHKRNAVREMVKALRDGIGVAIVIDQDAGPEGVFVPFFGRLASTTPTLARMALRTGAAVIPTFSIPNPDGSYRAVYGPEVTVEKSGDIRTDTLRLTAACTSILESYVRSHPEHWLWMHRRWKTPAPAGSREALARALATVGQARIPH